jgi:hypothetical protein
VKFKEWVDLLSPPKDYKQFAGSDLLDIIALIVIMGLLFFMVFM